MTGIEILNLRDSVALKIVRNHNVSRLPLANLYLIFRKITLN
jgi:hypothetical protein